MKSARWFIRLEENVPLCTPYESPLRRFYAKCLKCVSDRLCPTCGFDKNAGELRINLTCSCCRQGAEREVH